MATDIENLNLELIQAQILLRASQGFFRDVLLEITRRKISDDLVLADDLSRKIGMHVTRFAQRDEEIRRMLSRLEKLGRPINKIA
ncbi:MAG: hypothetical protein ACOY15_03230 [Pseudomonadota bacterium]